MEQAFMNKSLDLDYRVSFVVLLSMFWSYFLVWSNVGWKYEINNSHMLNWTPFGVAYDISHRPSMGRESFVCPAYSRDLCYLPLINSIGKSCMCSVRSCLGFMAFSGDLGTYPPWITWGLLGIILWPALTHVPHQAQFSLWTACVWMSKGDKEKAHFT